jgi:hypothetical protein
MPNKPIKQGYKIYGIADHGYLYNWIWSSREKGLQDILYRPGLTNTGCLVRQLVLSLPRSHLTVYLDNYFTSIPLFTELRACNYGAVGTTRPHKEFPDKLVKIKTQFATKLEWNTLLAAVVEDVLCLAWQDNNIVLALSNIHTVNRVEDFRERQRKRPAKTSTNGRIVRKVFGDEYIKELEIPCFIDDYNHYIGVVDLANQYQEAYETHRASLRNWWPLFYWLIDVCCINAYRLYVLQTVDISTKKLTHVQFRIELYCKLFEYSSKAKLQSLRLELSGKRVFGSDLPYLHYWEKRSRGNCVWCSYTIRCQRVLKKIDKKREQPKRSVWGCNFCQINLCREGGCWEGYHTS